MGVTVLNSQHSSVCAGTCDWTNRVVRAGSMPQAKNVSARSKTRFGRSTGSNGIVSAW